VLLLDARNHGRSDAAVFTSLPRFAEDVGHAVDWLKRQFPKNSRKIALLGHSVGAGAVLFETSRRDDIAVVISISAFAHPRWMMQRFLNRWYLPAPLAAGIIRYVQWVIQHPYDEIAPIRTLCHINCPVLLVHGKEDDTVPITDAREMIRRCHRDNIQLLEVDEAGHDSVERIEEQSDALVGFLHKAGFMRCADLTPAPASPPSDHR
jgi:pimeloyl-ACP methyl ester carboxylesterase